MGSAFTLSGTDQEHHAAWTVDWGVAAQRQSVQLFGWMPKITHKRPRRMTAAISYEMSIVTSPIFHFIRVVLIPRSAVGPFGERDSWPPVPDRGVIRPLRQLSIHVPNTRSTRSPPES